MKTASDVVSIVKAQMKIHMREWFEINFRKEPWGGFDVVLQARERDFSGRLEKLQDWLNQIRTLKPFGEIEYRTVLWPRLGGRLSDIPERISFHSLSALLQMPRLENERAQWKKATALLERIAPLPLSQKISVALIHHWKALVSMDPSNGVRLCELVHWLFRHRHPDCYIREIPVLGVDTKWLETHLGLVCSALEEVLGEPINRARFLSDWSFRTVPVFIRTRHAESFIQGLQPHLTVALPISAFLHARPRAVFVFENIQTGLAIKAPKDILLLFGLGADVKRIGQIDAFRSIPVLYMGDLDRHGLFILNELRKALPQVESVLMNGATLQTYRHLAVKDPTNDSKDRECDLLTQNETELLWQLKKDNLRLEQERIPIAVVEKAFNEALRDFSNNVRSSDTSKR